MHKTIALMCVVLTTMLAAPAARAEEEEPESKFYGLREHIGPIMHIAIDREGRLMLDRSAWEQPQEAANGAADGAVAVQVEGRAVMNIQVGGRAGAGGMGNVFQALGRAAGATGFRTMTSGQRRTQSFTGDSVSGNATTEGDEFEFELAEITPPGYHLRLSDSKAAGLRLTFTNFRGDIIIIAQSPSGVVSVALLDPERGEVHRAESFRELYRSQREFVGHVFFSRLPEMGARIFPDPLDPAVVSAVCSQLAPDPDIEAEFAKFIERLDAADYREREAATEELAEVGAQFLPQIRAAIEETPSAEVRERLATVIAGLTEIDRIQTVIEGLDLPNDIGYLIEILGRADQNVRPTVVERLETLTGATPGADQEAWMNWQANQDE